MIFEEDGVHHVEVDEITLKDAGTFTAIATNPLGQVTCSAELQVKGKYNLPMTWISS